jgi:NADPH2:quinone reductase
VLVTGGAGAVGEIAIQLARWAGARVIATVSTDAKAAVAQTAGAHHLIRYRDEDVVQAVRELTGGTGVDRVVEVEFGGNLPITTQIVRPGAVIATYGSMAVPVPELPFYPLMFANVTVRMLVVYLLGSDARANVIDRLAAAMADGVVRPGIALRVPLEETVRAHEAVQSGDLIGNAVIEIA